MQLICRICHGRGKTRCILCGYKPAKKKKEEDKTKEDREIEYYRWLWNKLKKFQMVSLSSDLDHENVPPEEIKKLELKIVSVCGEHWLNDNDFYFSFEETGGIENNHVAKRKKRIR